MLFGAGSLSVPGDELILVAGMAVLSRYALDVEDSLRLCNLVVFIKSKDISLTFYL